MGIAQKKRKVSRNTYEFDEHIKVAAWVLNNEPLLPALKLLYHPPMGELRSKAVGLKLKRMLARKGVADFHWPIARGGYIGLWIELKSQTGELSPEQAEFGGSVIGFGGAYLVARSAQEAITIIKKYYSERIERG